MEEEGASRASCQVQWSHAPCRLASPPQVTGLVAPNTDAVYYASNKEMYGVHWFNTPLIKWSKQNCTIETSYLNAVFLEHCPLTLFHNYDTMICEIYRLTPKPQTLEDVLNFKRAETTETESS